MPEPITREEYNQSLSRIHEKIDKINESSVRIETSAQIMQTSVEKMCDCIYGNGGKEGITAKIVRLFERISLHTKLIMAIFFSLLGIAFFIIRESLTK